MEALGLLDRLEAVRPHGTGRWSARCPAHNDRGPSLSVRQGERGVLLHCFAGCPLKDIVAAIGMSIRDLFYDHDRGPCRTRQVMRKVRDAETYALGLDADVLRSAEALIRSACDVDISGWSDERLDRELNRLGDAYALLKAEGISDVL